VYNIPKSTARWRCCSSDTQRPLGKNETARLSLLSSIARGLCPGPCRVREEIAESNLPPPLFRRRTPIRGKWPPWCRSFRARCCAYERRVRAAGPRAAVVGVVDDQQQRGGGGGGEIGRVAIETREEHPDSVPRPGCDVT